MNEPRVVPDEELDFEADQVFTLNGLPFTGVGYEESPEIGRSEVTYQDGLQTGPARSWDPSGVLRSESYYYGGALHGMSRKFDSDGTLTLESRYEYGILLHQRAFGPDEEVIESYELDPNSYNAELLERYRRKYNQPT
ncbi:toxin-antitoxin system YwqK family antitoxin [Flindersiella endophytica]